MSESDISLTTNHFFIECYCLAQGFSMVSQTLQDCSEWYAQLGLTATLQAGSVFIIVLINFLMSATASRIGLFEKRRNVSELETNVSIKLFAGLFLNSVCVLCVVNLNLGAFVSLPAWYEPYAVGRYSDFSCEWYGEVGVSMCLTMMINCINPHFVNLMMIPVTRLKQKLLAHEFQSQEYLIDLFKGEPFILAHRYSQLLCNSWIALLFGPGMPLMYWFAAFQCFSCYWCEKVCFIKVHATPPRYDAGLHKLFLSLLAPSLIFHLIFAIGMYTGPPLNTGGVLMGNVIAEQEDLLQADSTGPTAFPLLHRRHAHSLTRFPSLIHMHSHVRQKN